ncbi:hypothetical protein [Bdellovibrio bacteriovorus]|uniref:hypothetical protein n=1 Tax=Bdellovibrio bacteriovorus TaxID=959 RepID=UPI003CFD0023
MSDIELSLLTFTIGSSKLSDVKEKLGNGIIYHEGDAGNSLYVLCYEGPDGSIVTFESGEMGGTEHVITSGAIFSAKYTYRLKRHCSKLSLVNRNLKLADIRIGDSTTAVKKVKGVPSKDVKGLLIYSYETQELTTKGQADIISSVEVSFNSGKVSSIAVSKIESY